MGPISKIKFLKSLKTLTFHPRLYISQSIFRKFGISRMYMKLCIETMNKKSGIREEDFANYGTMTRTEYRDR